MTNASELAVFASRFSVPVNAAHVLPALFARAAESAGLPVRSLIAEATYRNRALGEYLAECALRVAKEVSAQ